MAGLTGDPTKGAIVEDRSGSTPSESKYVDASIGVGSAKQVAATITSATPVQFTNGIRGVLISARDCDIRWMMGDNTVTANAVTSHWLRKGTSRVFRVGSYTYITAIRDSNAEVDGVLEITELV